MKEFLLRLFSKKFTYLNIQTTKTIKASPTPIPANRIRVLSTKILLENSGKTLRSSEVTRSIIAVMANHIAMSNGVSGKFIVSPYPVLSDQVKSVLILFSRSLKIPLMLAITLSKSVSGVNFSMLN
jgi:hypothetical protein